MEKLLAQVSDISWLMIKDACTKTYLLYHMKKRITNRRAIFLHVANFGIVTMIPVICNALWGNRFGLGMFKLIYFIKLNNLINLCISILLFFSVGAVIVCAVYIVTFLKLWSYVQVNYWCRLHKENSAKSLRRRASSVLVPGTSHLTSQFFTIWSLS